jgi:hypothetical protein
MALLLLVLPGKGNVSLLSTQRLMIFVRYLLRRQSKINKPYKKQGIMCPDFAELTRAQQFMRK